MLISNTRLIQTHEPWRREYARAIYLVRDVRDVVISEYHFQQLWGLYDGSFHDFLGDFLAGRVNRYGSWDNHTNSWLDAKEAAHDQILMIRFDDLRHDTRATLATTLAFLGAFSTDAQIEEAIANNTASRMREKESRHRYASESEHFVRKGEVGGWQRILSDAQVQLLEQATGPTLSRLGIARGRRKQ